MQSFRNYSRNSIITYFKGYFRNFKILPGLLKQKLQGFLQVFQKNKSPELFSSISWGRFPWIFLKLCQRDLRIYFFPLQILPMVIPKILQDFLQEFVRVFLHELLQRCLSDIFPGITLKIPARMSPRIYFGDSCKKCCRNSFTDYYIITFSEYTRDSTEIYTEIHAGLLSDIFPRISQTFL